MEGWPFTVDSKQLGEWFGVSGEEYVPFVRRWPSARKWLLLGCGCLRRVWSVLPDACCREVVELAERYADGEPVRDRLAALAPRCQAVEKAEWRQREAEGFGWEAPFGVRGGRARAAGALCHVHPAEFDSYYFAQNIAQAIHGTVWGEGGGDDVAGVQEVRDFLRDIFGVAAWNASVDPACLTSTVVSLAEGIYVGRAFDRLPILADALQDAGCDNADILDHCRGSGTHVRGCWVVDMVLGKE
jgi:hypothetical protein